MAYMSLQTQPLGVLSTIKDGLKTAIYNMQKARFIGVLSQMSDAELAQIGVRREDILQYTENLMQ